MTAEATIAPWLKEWLASVPRGMCPACRKALPPHKGRGRPRYVHSAKAKPECRKEYLRRRTAAGASTPLRTVTARTFPRETPGRAVLTLSCGCSWEMRASDALRITKRTRCPNHP